MKVQNAIKLKWKFGLLVHAHFFHQLSILNYKIRFDFRIL
jgi:hypothetical protein